MFLKEISHVFIDSLIFRSKLAIFKKGNGEREAGNGE